MMALTASCISPEKKNQTRSFFILRNILVVHAVRLFEVICRENILNNLLVQWAKLVRLPTASHITVICMVIVF